VNHYLYATVAVNEPLTKRFLQRDGHAARVRDDGTMSLVVNAGTEDESAEAVKALRVLGMEATAAAANLETFAAAYWGATPEAQARVSGPSEFRPDNELEFLLANQAGE
jgi:hypothetical protein